MARPRRTIEQEWIDMFCDWDIAKQERALVFAGALHRQAKQVVQDARAKPVRNAGGSLRGKTKTN